jgi:hypothetical protein
MIACNVFLMACLAGLGVFAARGGTSLHWLSRQAGASHQVVEDYLAARLPEHQYRIRQWFPATPLDEEVAGAPVVHFASAPGPKVAQRVKLVFYGPAGPRQVDTVFWLQNGQVVGRMDTRPNSSAREWLRPHPPA